MSFSTKQIKQSRSAVCQQFYTVVIKFILRLFFYISVYDIILDYICNKNNDKIVRRNVFIAKHYLYLSKLRMEADILTNIYGILRCYLTLHFNTHVYYIYITCSTIFKCYIEREKLDNRCDDFWHAARKLWTTSYNRPTIVFRIYHMEIDTIT